MGGTKMELMQFVIKGRATVTQCSYDRDATLVTYSATRSMHRDAIHIRAIITGKGIKKAHHEALFKEAQQLLKAYL